MRVVAGHSFGKWKLKVCRLGGTKCARVKVRVTVTGIGVGVVGGT